MNSLHGSTRLGPKGLLARNPALRTLYSVPEEGPPRLIESDDPRRTAVSQAESKDPTRSPPPGTEDKTTNVPQIPERSLPINLTQTKPCRPSSPSPESLSLPEAERPSSWQEELLASSPSERHPSPITAGLLLYPPPRKRALSPVPRPAESKVRITPNADNACTPMKKQTASTPFPPDTPAGASEAVYHPPKALDIGNKNRPKYAPPRRVPAKPYTNAPSLSPRNAQRNRKAFVHDGFISQTTPRMTATPTDTATPGTTHQMVNDAVPRALSLRPQPNQKQASSPSNPKGGGIISPLDIPLRTKPPPL